MLTMGVGIGLMIGTILAGLTFMFPDMQRIAAGAPLSNAHMQAGAPGLISYQGFLSAANNQPYTGTASLEFAIYESSSGGSPLWQESQNNVSVGAGYFTVQLGSVTPLTAAIFDGPTRYLQVSVDIGSGPETLPRQRLTAVPYAFQAETAASAASADAAPWDGLTGVPAGFADGVDDSGASYENMIVVASSGGDYTSVAAALDSISSPSASNRYLVWVAPGVYSETELLEVRAYVHLQGAGPNVTVVTSSRTNSVQNSDAATARLYDNGRISDITLRNTGTGTYGIAVWSNAATRTAVIDNAVLEAIGDGGVGHYGVYLSASAPSIKRSILRASGAANTGVNAALGSSGPESGGFAQPLVEDSMLIGGNSDSNGLTCAGNSGSGYGIQYTRTAATVRRSYICGDYRAITGGIGGISVVEGSNLAVSSNFGAYLVEANGTARIQVVSSGVFYTGNRLEPLTPTNALACTLSYSANYSELNSTCQ